MTKYKVIFHLDEPSKGRADQVMGNITNLLNDLSNGNVEVEVLANGGVRALAKGPEGQANRSGGTAGKAWRAVCGQPALSRVSEFESGRLG